MTDEGIRRIRQAQVIVDAYESRLGLACRMRIDDDRLTIYLGTVPVAAVGMLWNDADGWRYLGSVLYGEVRIGAIAAVAAESAFRSESC